MAKDFDWFWDNYDKYQKPIAHQCKWPSYFSILLHGGFWEKARAWQCKECSKFWRPKKLVSTGDFTWLEVKVGEGR